MFCEYLILFIRAALVSFFHGSYGDWTGLASEKAATEMEIGSRAKMEYTTGPFVSFWLFFAVFFGGQGRKRVTLLIILCLS